MQTYEALNLISIDPVDIIGSSTLWCVDVKTRKLYQYIAHPINGPLNVNGSIVVGFDEKKSIGKTLKDMPVQLASFKKASKKALESFMDGLTTMEIMANGKITSNQVILKVL